MTDTIDPTPLNHSDIGIGDTSSLDPDRRVSFAPVDPYETGE